jgi:alginate O-acetyltransferase complex protein AlgI
MLFNSFHFAFFFVFVTALYFILPHKFRWFLLLVSSCYFYMAFIPVYILILGFTIIIDYFAGIYIEKSIGKQRKLLLILSLVANIGILAIFKYYNFFNDNFSFLLQSFGVTNPIPALTILLPIGLSFHTFQAMSYTIEVYRGNQNAEKHFGIYSLYVMFYPQLVAGPIERPQNLLHQFREKHDFDYKRVTDGLKLMAWGLFKKVVIADRLAEITDKIFTDVTAYDGFGAFLGMILFTFQIFCDFSGYSDIALGTAQVMGFKLMENFKRPYFSQSIAEFWKRWHISLSTWFKDYLYISLDGNRVSVPRWYFNLFFVFLVSGFWHGASWTFIIWGALHGFYLVFALIIEPLKAQIENKLGLLKYPAFYKIFNIFITFSLVSFTWIFFRAGSQSFIYIRTLFMDWHGTLDADYLSNLIFVKLNIGIITLILVPILIIFMELVHYYQEKHGSVRVLIAKQPFYIRWAIYYSFLFAFMFLGIQGEHQFIYFQF